MSTSRNAEPSGGVEAGMRRWVRAAAFLVVLLGAGSCGHSTISGSAAGPGVIIGIYGVHSSSSSDVTPAAGVRVGLFLHEVSFGGPAMSPAPEPFVDAVTASDGTFRFDGLDPGRYFVVAMSPGGSGQWVVITSADGARVELTGCSDCPIAL
jgi:hypothetical protein